MKLFSSSSISQSTRFPCTSRHPRRPIKTGIFADLSSPDDLASEFHRHLNASNLDQPQITGPSHLLPPTTVVTAQMNALQRNDYPHTDAGLQTCFLFSKPFDPTFNTPSLSGRVCSWKAGEHYLTYEEFTQQIKTHSFYKYLINLEEWTPLEAGCQFPSSRFQDKAVMGVEVTLKVPHHHNDDGGDNTTSSDMNNNNKYRFTWLLEKVKEGGLNNCWMIVGVRVGDYVS